MCSLVIRLARVVEKAHSLEGEISGQFAAVNLLLHLVTQIKWFMNSFSLKLL